MKIALIQVGGTVDSYLKIGVEEYIKRLKHYVSFEIIELKDQKNAARGKTSE